MPRLWVDRIVDGEQDHRRVDLLALRSLRRDVERRTPANRGALRRSPSLLIRRRVIDARAGSGAATPPLLPPLDPTYSGCKAPFHGLRFVEQARCTPIDVPADRWTALAVSARLVEPSTTTDGPKWSSSVWCACGSDASTTRGLLPPALFALRARARPSPPLTAPSQAPPSGACILHVLWKLRPHVFPRLSIEIPHLLRAATPTTIAHVFLNMPRQKTGGVVMDAEPRIYSQVLRL